MRIATRELLNANERERVALREARELGTAIAWVATTVAYAVGNAGGTVRVVTGWSPDDADLTYFEVVATVAVSIALGAVLLWAMQRRAANAFGPWVLVAAGVAVLSAVPLWRLDVDTRSKLALTTMHLLTGACAVAGQALVRRGTAGS